MSINYSAEILERSANTNIWGVSPEVRAYADEFKQKVEIAQHIANPMKIIES